MKPLPTDDTIVALATPPGSGAIAVIRLSGPAALGLADRVFRGKAPLAGSPGYRVHHGFIVDEWGEPVDEVLATVFRAPRSYTGEDLVEIGCHGGMMVSGRVLEVLAAAGARHASPGEFTRRAFLYGRMDLSQAEAVMGLISSQSRAAGRASLAQLEGRLGHRVQKLRSLLLDLCALLELELDFAEEGLAVLDPTETRARLEVIMGDVAGLAATYSQGRLLRDGAGVVLVGRPNAGKSSLFNALLREARAIVTPDPGTTRDLLEETVILEGIPFRLHDTAGLRETEEAAEREGVRRSLSAVAGADLLVVVLDPEDLPEQAEVESFRGYLSPGQKVIWALNKCDRLAGGMSIPWLSNKETVIEVSALTGAGLHELEKLMVSTLEADPLPVESVAVTSQRQFLALQEAHVSLEKALEAHGAGLSNEFISLDVREAAGKLAEITGEITSDDVLNGIFDRFCIGK
jgi:tRNA modification GTPase